jgi:hypothetical protein
MDYKNNVSERLEGKPMLALLVLVALQYVLEPAYNFIENRFFSRFKRNYTDFTEVKEDSKNG